MGKSKYQKHKINNVFKVAGGRSAKAKNKMKTSDTDRLKNLYAQNKKQIESIDKQMLSLTKEIRQLSQPKSENGAKNQITSSSTRAQEVELYRVTEENCEQALEKLNSFTM